MQDKCEFLTLVQFETQTHLEVTCKQSGPSSLGDDSDLLESQQVVDVDIVFY